MWIWRLKYNDKNICFQDRVQCENSQKNHTANFFCFTSKHKKCMECQKKQKLKKINEKKKKSKKWS